MDGLTIVNVGNEEIEQGHCNGRKTCPNKRLETWVGLQDILQRREDFVEVGEIDRRCKGREQREPEDCQDEDEESDGPRSKHPLTPWKISISPHHVRGGRRGVGHELHWLWIQDGLDGHLACRDRVQSHECHWHRRVVGLPCRLDLSVQFAQPLFVMFDGVDFAALEAQEAMPDPRRRPRLFDAHDVVPLSCTGFVASILEQRIVLGVFRWPVWHPTLKGLAHIHLESQVHSPCLLELAQDHGPLAHKIIQLLPILAQRHALHFSNLQILDRFFNFLFISQLGGDSGETNRTICDG